MLDWIEGYYARETSRNPAASGPYRIARCYLSNRAAWEGGSRPLLVVEAFGLAGLGYHARDEFIDTDSIVPRHLMTRMLQELGKK